MSSTTEYAGLLLVDPLGADSAMSGSSWVESQAGIAPTSNMQIIDALLKQKASFTVKTADEWSTDTTTILRANDFGVVSDTGEVRRGDGIHAWGELTTFDPGNASGKVDKVLGAVGHLVQFANDGAIADSGKKIDDFASATHTHGNLTNDGKLGSVADQVAVTDTGGALITKSAAEMRTLLDVPQSDSKQDKITVQGIVKGDGAGGVSAAQSGVDFALPATLYTAILTAAGWNNKSQTVSVAGVTANNVVLVQVQADSSQAYRMAKVMADATQVAGQLTFSCTTTPTVDLTVMIIVLG